MLCTLLTFAAMMPQGPGPSPALVVINEYSFDDSSTDDLEFVELWNRTAVPVDISGWVVQNEEGVGATINPSFTFPAATSINPGQYIVVGNAAVPNVNFVVAGGFLENGPGDGITLRDAALNVIDGVAYGYAGWTNVAPIWLEGTPHYGRHVLNENQANPVSSQRKVDGYDSDNNGLDFVYMTWTPGAANGGNNVFPGNYVQFFDAVAGTSLGSDFATSFVAARTVDPASVPNSTTTTIVVPPSPQGGNIGLMHDPTGGGDMNAVRLTVRDDFLVECYVYVTGGNAVLNPATEGEVWGIGVGTTDSYGSPPDVPGNYYATTGGCAGAGNREPGGTGIAWLGYNRGTHTDVYLVDLNDGGLDWTILGGPIVATPGTNDGWQRVRLRVSGTNVTGNFGGTFGCNDGTVFTAAAPLRPSGQVYFQYRECIVANANLTPLMVDRLEIYGIASFSTSFAGAPSPTTVGVPVIGTTGGDPVIGNGAFAITGSNFPSGTLAGLAVTVGTLNAGVQMPGAQAGCLLFTPTPFDIFGLAFADGSGNAGFALGIPCDNFFSGLPIAVQWLVADVALLDPLPIGSSTGLQLVLGN